MMTNLYTRMSNAIAETKDNEEGISSIEYGLMAVGIALVMGAAATGVGGALVTLFGEIATDLTAP